MTLFAVSIHPLEKLTELRNTIYLLVYRFIRKGTNQEELDGRDASCKVWGMAVELPCSLWASTLPEPLCVHQHRSSPNSAFWGFFGGFTM